MFMPSHCFCNPKGYLSIFHLSFMALLAIKICKSHNNWQDIVKSCRISWSRAFFSNDLPMTLIDVQRVTSWPLWCYFPCTNLIMCDKQAADKNGPIRQVNTRQCHFHQLVRVKMQLIPHWSPLGLFNQTVAKWLTLISWVTPTKQLDSHWSPYRLTHPS